MMRAALSFITTALAVNGVPGSYERAYEASDLIPGKLAVIYP